MKKLILTFAVISAASIANADLGVKMVTCLNADGSAKRNVAGHITQNIMYVVSAENTHEVMIRTLAKTPDEITCTFGPPVLLNDSHCEGGARVSAYTYTLSCKYEFND